MPTVSWDDLSDATEAGLAVLKGAGITAAVAKRVVEELGYVEPSDLTVSCAIRSMRYAYGYGHRAPAPAPMAFLVS
jgi:hypothetical protein